MRSQGTSSVFLMQMDRDVDATGDVQAAENRREIAAPAGLSRQEARAE
jgi:hypothetical protein